MTAADTRYLNRKRRQLNTHRGIPNRLSADKARAHIAHLRQTMSWEHIATATGCSACHLRNIATGRATIINRVTHNKILRTQAAPTTAAGFYIDATGTRRRIHALQAIGYSQATIATAAGTTPYRICIISRGTDRVRQKVADRVAAAYTRLARTTPPDDRYTRRARRHAAHQGWPGPDFWEDYDHLDDPDFDPAAADREPEPGELAATRRRDIIHLTRYGYDPEAIHARLRASGHDIALSTVQGVVREHRAGVRRQRRVVAR